jgi:hypothetical protein
LLPLERRQLSFGGRVQLRDRLLGTLDDGLSSLFVKLVHVLHLVAELPALEHHDAFPLVLRRKIHKPAIKGR